MIVFKKYTKDKGVSPKSFLKPDSDLTMLRASAPSQMHIKQRKIRLMYKYIRYVLVRLQRRNDKVKGPEWRYF